MAQDFAEWMATGDALWLTRGEGSDGPWASPESIDPAISAFEAAFELDPSSIEARWKLMRALFFKGEHQARDPVDQLAAFKRARDLGEELVEQWAEAHGSRDALLELTKTDWPSSLATPTEAARTFFWTAVNWGVWGRTRGKLASAREGVASKIRDLAAVSAALDNSIENGGGHRVTGRLHTEAPKIPFITGWIDRDTAIRELEICLTSAPEDLLTKLYLGEALTRFDKARKQEGVDLLRVVAESTPQGEFLVEESKAVEDARNLLAELGE